ncbi:MAG: hypothetical protein HRU19_00070 [Pseudobacteriovorax sp.]|nr:hypothetical protein [Pseudobacteriovorax sp.]
MEKLSHIFVILFFFSSLSQAAEVDSYDFSKWKGSPFTLKNHWKVSLGLHESRDTGSWSPASMPASFLETDPESGGFGSMTFHIELKQLKSDLGMKFRADSASKVIFYREGSVPRVIDEIGVVALPEGHVPKIAARYHRLPVSIAGDYHLIIQVQNFDYHDGLIWQIPTIANYTTGYRSWKADLILEFFAFGILFILTFYNICIYVQRAQERENFWFSIFCVFLLLRVSATSGFLFDYIFPDASYFIYQVQRRLEFGTVPICSLSIAIFARFLYREAIHPRMIQSLKFLAVAVGLSALLLPIHYLDYTVIPTDLSILLSYSVITVTTVRAYKQNLVGSRLFALGFFLLLVGTVNDLLIGIGILKNWSFFGVWGMNSFIICLILYIAKKFSLAYKTMEKLYTDLDHSYQQLSKVFYPHQISQIQSGSHLENTMNTDEGFGVVISFDIVRSSRIKNPRLREFLEDSIYGCVKILSENYSEEQMSSNGYRIKEMGDGFICSVGYPFATPNGRHAVDLAIELSHKFIQNFEAQVQHYGLNSPAYCGIGIAMGELHGYYPKFGTKEYDLFGRPIILATRYESMRKELFPAINHHSLIVQQSVFEAMSRMRQTDFEYFALDEYVSVPDDESAQGLYYQLIASQNQIDAIKKRTS